MAFARTAVSTTGNTTLNSATLTVASNAGMFVGMCIYGTGIKPDTVITNIVGTTITMSLTASATGTGVTVTGQYITQTGTDTDPSGLAAMVGVTSNIQGTGTRLSARYDLGTNQLRIQGTFTHNPDQHCIVGNVQLSIIIEGTYNFGIEKVVSGRSSYSKGCGLDLTYNGGIASNFPIQLRSGAFNWRGGIIRFGGAFSMTGGLFNQRGDTSVAYNNNSGTQIQLRTILPPASMVYDKIKLAGDNSTFFWTTQTYSTISANLENGAVQTPAGFSATQTYSDFIFANNQAPADFYINQLSSATSTLSIVKNPDAIPRVAQLNSGAYGVVEIRESLSFAVSDANGNPAANVIGYVKDSNNGARTDENQLTYTADKVYIATSNTSGALNMGDVLVDVQMRNPAATTTVKHDYRSNFGNGSTDFNQYLGGYDYNPVVTRQTLIGNGGKSVLWTIFNDTNVTLSRDGALAKLASSFTVDPVTKTVTVTANSTYDDLYDALKAWKYNGTQINAETPTISNLILSTNGQNLTAFTGWTLVVNTGVTLSAGTKFTYVKFDTVTNNGSITGVYANSTGTSTIWQFQDVEAGTSLVIYDTSGVTKYFQGEVTSAGTYSYYIPPQASASTYFYAIEKYGTRREEGSFPSNAGGVLFYVPSYAEDVGISQTTKATVSAYTEIDNLDKFYDYTAFKRLSENFIKLGQIATRNGTAVDIGAYSLVVNQSSGAVESVTGSTITIKSSSFANGSKFTLMTATPPATVTANSTEVITASIEDANGDSSVTIQGGSGDFTLWKISNATSEDDYATGTNLGNVTNTIFRFLQAPGFKIVIRDNITSFRQVVPMDKGIYVRGLFFGDQVQLAQSAEVTQINSKVDLLQTELGQVMMSFDVSTDSLHAISDAVDLLPTLTEMEASTILAKEASVQEIITTVDGLATQVSVDALGAPLQAVDYVAPDNTTISEIKVLVEAIEPTDLTPLELDLERIEKNTKTIIGLTA